MTLYHMLTIILDDIVIIILDHIVSTITMDNIVAFKTIVAFLIPLVALLTS
jgi:hypothetical protein